MSYLTELALRTAANTNNRELSSKEDKAESIKDKALSRSKQLIQSCSNISTKDIQIAAETTAISLAVTGLVLAYRSISEQMAVIKKQRLSFEKERLAGIATFVVPTLKETRNYSKEERIIKAFIKLMLENDTISSYLGIHHAELNSEKNEKFYSVLPFYRMSGHLEQPLASSKPLDKQRTVVNLFLRSALPDAIGDIETHFQEDKKFMIFLESKYQKSNYLNDRRAPRFIMMALSNLLWNLLHPVDQDGFPLPNHICITLCQNVEFLLDQLLNPESPAYVKEISNKENELMHFIFKLKNHTSALKDAYVEEQMHELNIQEISNSAHSVLRVMDKSIFKLIYKRPNAISGECEPDETAAESIADKVYYLNILLCQNGDLLDPFLNVPHWIHESSGINNPPSTIIDILIIFCHLPSKERDELLEKIAKNKKSSALEFVSILKNFDMRFVQPIRDISKAELNVSNQIEVSRLTARRLIPLITLVVKDYRIDVDLPRKISRIKPSSEKSKESILLTGKQQVAAINSAAESGNGYYTWALSPFILMSVEVASEIDTLPKRQYRLTHVTELLDNLAFLVENYHHFLQNKLFQAFMLRCLAKIKEEYSSLFHHIAKVDSFLAQDERISRLLKAILTPMTRKLNRRLEAFTLASAHFERIVSAPDFTEQQKKILASKLSAISEQFYELFKEDSGILPLIDLPLVRSPLINQRRLASDLVDTKTVVMLIELVERCYQALSYQSTAGHKGALLRELIQLIKDKPHFTEAQIKHFVLELARITASYRETWLFQASYGETRSAKALIAAIKEPSLNNTLPLADIIFGQAVNISELSDAQILHRLNHLREGNFWQESSSKIRLLPLV